MTFNDSLASEFTGPSPITVTFNDTTVRELAPRSFQVRKNTPTTSRPLLNLQPSHAQLTHKAVVLDTTTVASNQTITYDVLMTTREYLTTTPTLSLHSVAFLNENVTILLDEPYASCTCANSQTCSTCLTDVPPYRAEFVARQVPLSQSTRHQRLVLRHNQHG